MTVVAKNLKDEKRANRALVDECKKLLTPEQQRSAARHRKTSNKAA